jgi:anti-anti-sigma regulatory factor
MHFLRAVWTAGGERAVVTLTGEIDVAEVGMLDALGAVATQTPGFVVDLSRVSFVDVAGLAALERLLDAPNIAERNPSPVITQLRSLLSG